ncbi:MAG: SLC13 family permease [Acidobacteriaceae bacterium]
MPSALAHILLPAIVAVSILLMLLRPHDISEVWWISGGALLLITLHLIPLKLAGTAIAQGSDVYLFLIGMMLLAELAREHGVFDWVSSIAVTGAKGSCNRLFFLVYAVGTIVTIFMSNDATAVVLTPAILVVVRKARISPLPYLFICALVANAASFVLPISNPANLVVFHTGVPPLAAWLSSFGLPSMLSIGATYVVMRLFFRKELCTRISHEVEPVELSGMGKAVLWGLGLVVCVLLAASAMKWDLGLPTCVAALAIAVGVSVLAKSNPMKLLREISWKTILLVAGLFVLVNAVESQGALNATRAWLAAVQQLAPVADAMIVGLVVGVANNLVNNLPLGLIAGGTLRAAHVQGLVANAVMIGVDLGPNLSVTGSLATILWLLALRKEKVEVSFWQFLKLGMLAMPIALVAALGGALLMAKI